MAGLGKAASVAGLITFGTTTSLFAKIVYELQSVGLDGQKKYFHKPWAMTSVMFLGMSLCLPLAYWEQHKKKRAQSEAEQPLLSNPDEAAKPRSELRDALMLSIPTAFDLLATILMNIGLLYVTASVYQMMRGAEMLFAALFAVTFLKRSLNKYHLMGLLCCVAGISLVGSSSLLSGEGSATQIISQEQMLLGMGLIIISQAVQAAQLTFEDFFMADMNIPAMKIVGYEGVFGVVGTLIIMAPIAYHMKGVEGEGFHENILDTLEMIRNSRQLAVILAIDMLALLAYNVTGMMVTGHSGAVFRTVLETMRTLFVWLVDLMLYYGGFGLGESWSVYSWLQLAGFVVLVTGTLVYGRGDEEDLKKEIAEAMAVQASVEPLAAETTHPAPGAAPGTAVPIAARPPLAPTTPMSMAGSYHQDTFRATHTIVAGSLGRSLQGPSHLHRRMEQEGDA
eukprot:CAMPEP_0202889878 /NCGR_PEP_ID=MMETSP1392-20130828/425_1 /ASSEMBLY_ACC=CAM_ASM_000868 /TAXON_ID=225041 /ORGANISM="Chlamydomonas chlamydogama, Strain SAG 11-48b" /LENGTH=450 /DNA_ID=CAMNT_0049573309 /DNA_START=124 /DNA_END=1476 /DNA_ORIENTATION=+